MFKNIIRLSNNCISKRCFTTTSSTSSTLFNSFGSVISTNKIYKFNLDGTLKTKENDQSTLSLNQLEPILNSLSLNENQLYNQQSIIIEDQSKSQPQQEMSSILIKRRKKMSKHKHKKLRKRTRALKKRLGKI